MIYAPPALGERETIELRLGPATRGEAIAGPLVAAVAARAGLTVQELDELQMAVEMVMRGRGETETTMRIHVESGRLTIEVAPVPAGWAARRRTLLETLAGRMSLDGDRVELRAGG
jgi:hypothetical protein